MRYVTLLADVTFRRTGDTLVVVPAGTVVTLLARPYTAPYAVLIFGDAEARPRARVYSPAQS